jgi:CO/xanthine dehydrogenase Mo-binding subunit
VALTADGGPFKEIVRDQGQVVNANLADYLIPAVTDLPAEFSVALQ